MGDAAVLPGLLFAGSLVILLVAAAFYWSAKRGEATRDSRIVELHEAQELHQAVEALLHEFDREIEDRERRLRSLLAEMDSRTEELPAPDPRKRPSGARPVRSDVDEVRSGTENLKERIPRGEAELRTALSYYQKERAGSRGKGRRPIVGGRVSNRIWEELSS